jgi:hypothetical protein
MNTKEEKTLSGPGCCRARRQFPRIGAARPILPAHLLPIHASAIIITAKHAPIPIGIRNLHLHQFAIIPKPHLFYLGFAKKKHSAPPFVGIRNPSTHIIPRPIPKSKAAAQTQKKANMKIKSITVTTNFSDDSWHMKVEHLAHKIKPLKNGFVTHPSLGIIFCSQELDNDKALEILVEDMLNAYLKEISHLQKNIKALKSLSIELKQQNPKTRKT